MDKKGKPPLEKDAQPKDKAEKPKYIRGIATPDTKK